MGCSHEKTKVRLRTQRDGQRIPWEQCLRCGKGMRPVAKKDAPPDIEHLLWDEELPVLFDEAERAEWEAGLIVRDIANDEKRAEWHDWYYEYLQSPKWKAIRAKTMDRTDGICEGCHERPATEVHHLSYEFVGDEMLWDLVAVCSPCHRKVHKKQEKI